jgi:chorismate synthase
MVAAGVIAKKIIQPISIVAKIEEICGKTDFNLAINEAIKAKDSIGGIISCTAKNMKIGLGEPFFYSLESYISHLIFSIPGVKAIEFGAGFAAAKMKGSECNDNIIDIFGKTETNNSGGINGGIANGNDLFFKLAVKPTSSIALSQKTMNFKTKELTNLHIKGRHDACMAMRMPPIVEAATAIALADLMFQNQNRK